MKLIRWIDADKIKTGIVIDDTFYDTSGFGEDYDEYFFEAGGLQRLEKFINLNKKNYGVNLQVLAPVGSLQTSPHRLSSFPTHACYRGKLSTSVFA